MNRSQYIVQCIRMEIELNASGGGLKVPGAKVPGPAFHYPTTRPSYPVLRLAERRQQRKKDDLA